MFVVSGSGRVIEFEWLSGSGSQVVVGIKLYPKRMQLINQKIEASLPRRSNLHGYQATRQTND